MNKMNQSGWKPGTPVAADDGADHPTVTGNKALMLEERLIFEIGTRHTCGLDLPEPDTDAPGRLGKFARKQPIDLPGLSEPETVRHYTRLSRQNYAIDLGLFPLGSCTMKHNPRLNEKVARMPGFADVHPLQPVDTIKGALGVIDELSHWLIELTGMSAVAMSPKAGAHGELCGILCIRAAMVDEGAGAASADFMAILHTVEAALAQAAPDTRRERVEEEAALAVLRAAGDATDSHALARAAGIALATRPLES